MLASEAVKNLGIELGITQVTLYKWRRQALIDAGRDRASRGTYSGVSRTKAQSCDWYPAHMIRSQLMRSSLTSK